MRISNLQFSIFSKSFQMFPDGMESFWDYSMASWDILHDIRLLSKHISKKYQRQNPPGTHGFETKNSIFLEFNMSHTTELLQLEQVRKIIQNLSRRIFHIIFNFWKKYFWVPMPSKSQKLHGNCNKYLQNIFEMKNFKALKIVPHGHGWWHRFCSVPWVSEYNFHDIRTHSRHFWKTIKIPFENAYSAFEAELVLHKQDEELNFLLEFKMSHMTELFL